MSVAGGSRGHTAVCWTRPRTLPEGQTPQPCSRSSLPWGKQGGFVLGSEERLFTLPGVNEKGPCSKPWTFNPGGLLQQHVVSWPPPFPWRLLGQGEVGLVNKVPPTVRRYFLKKPWAIYSGVGSWIMFMEIHTSGPQAQEKVPPPAHKPCLTSIFSPPFTTSPPKPNVFPHSLCNIHSLPSHWYYHLSPCCAPAYL